LVGNAGARDCATGLLVVAVETWSLTNYITMGIQRGYGGDTRYNSSMIQWCFMEVAYSQPTICGFFDDEPFFFGTLFSDKPM